MSSKTLSALGSVLDGLGIAWTLIGAVAANRYRREVRLTGDVDLLIASLGPSLGELEAAFEAQGWSVRRGTPDGALLRLRHPEFGAADLLLAETDYQQSALARSRREVIDETTQVAVLQVEDVLIHKLVAGRARDLDDIGEILAADWPLDEDYVEHWATFWDVLALWRQLRRAER